MKSMNINSEDFLTRHSEQYNSVEELMKDLMSDDDD